MDPFDVSINTLRVQLGVPSRRGLRSTRIIDGPETGLEITEAARFDIDSVYIAQGVSTAEKGASFIGHDRDAFVITQEYTLNQGGTSKCRYGYRRMIESSIKTWRLPSCKCDKLQGKESASTSRNASACTVSSIDELLEGNNKFRTDWSSQDSDLERVFASKHHGRHFIYVSDSPIARWLQLQILHDVAPWTPDSENYREVAMRDQNTCINCATRFLPSKVKVLL